jgi:hypothetical protein
MEVQLLADQEPENLFFGAVGKQDSEMFKDSYKPCGSLYLLSRAVL